MLQVLYPNLSIWCMYYFTTKSYFSIALASNTCKPQKLENLLLQQFCSTNFVAPGFFSSFAAKSSGSPALFFPKKLSWLCHYLSKVSISSGSFDDPLHVNLTFFYGWLLYNLFLLCFQCYLH